MTTTITKSNHSHQHFGKRGLCHWKDFPQIADIQIHRAGIHAQTPEIYAQGGDGYTHRGVGYTHRGHTSIGYRHLSKAEVYVGTFSNKLSEKVLASTSLSKM
jgi:hypothetical protein